MATYLYFATIEPNLTYGTEVWGVSTQVTEQMDKLCLWHLKSTLGVKTSTSNHIMLGELGIIPPTVKCHIKILCYYDRLRSLPDDMLVKRAYNEALKLHEQGFTTWVSKVWDIANKYEINLDNINWPFWNTIKQLVTEHFKNHWKSSIVDIAFNPILRTYKLFKTDFKIETYLGVVKDNRYRHTLINCELVLTPSESNVVGTTKLMSRNACAHIVWEAMTKITSF